MSILRQFITPVLAPALHEGARLAVNRFARRDPVTAQRKLFMHLVQRAATTRFGRDHEFSTLVRKPFEQAYPLYRNLVPIRTYADFWRDYFLTGSATPGGTQRLVLDNVTWPGRIPLFCETSGTTAPTK